MTHSNHRQGIYANLTNDFVVLAYPSMQVNDFPQKLRKYNDIGRRYGPVNAAGVESVLSERHLVFDNKDKVRSILNDLAKSDLGLSIIVSGLRDQVAECCKDAGLKPHTVCQSMGIWGNIGKLPDPRILEVTTMCGHGRVSPNLVWDFAQKIRNGATDVKAASRSMGKLCLCNIFNLVRSEKLLHKMVRDLEAGIISPPVPRRNVVFARKDSGITIDQSKCTGCMICLPYCPVSAIVETVDGTVNIDPERCYECGVCLQAEACPADAIVGLDLSWPRSLRGKFQNPYAPYHHASTLLPAEPVKYSDEVKIVSKHESPSVLSNDSEGLLQPGETEVIAEMGRPHVGSSFRDIQKVIQALLPAGLKLSFQYPVLDERRPITDLMIDVSRGIFREDILEEKIGWITIKLTVPNRGVVDVFKGLKEVAAEIDTVFAVDVLTCVVGSPMTMADLLAGEIGIYPACNCKTNVGLGRPLAKMNSAWAEHL